MGFGLGSAVWFSLDIEKKGSYILGDLGRCCPDGCVVLVGGGMRIGRMLVLSLLLGLGCSVLGLFVLIVGGRFGNPDSLGGDLVGHFGGALSVYHAWFWASLTQFERWLEPPHSQVVTILLLVGIPTFDWACVVFVAWVIVAKSRMARYRRSGRCERCGYDLCGGLGDRCSECGTEMVGQGKGRLGFAGSAIRSFEFLSGLGFRIVRRDATIVRFENGVVYLNVYHGRRSYMIGVEIGRKEKDRELFNLHEVLEAMVPAEERRRCYQTSDAELLEEYLLEVAGLWEKWCGDLLVGDSAAFSRVEEVATDIRERVTVDAMYGAVICRANEAWERKDYRTAKKLYEEAESGLDEAGRRRLEYLRGRRGV